MTGPRPSPEVLRAAGAALGQDLVAQAMDMARELYARTADPAPPLTAEDLTAMELGALCGVATTTTVLQSMGLLPGGFTEATSGQHPRFTEPSPDMPY